MIMKVRKAKGSDNIDRLIFMCPGCDEMHQVTIGTQGKWGWNNSLDSPTIEGSVLVSSPDEHLRCHSFIFNGEIMFLADCTHQLANKTVPLPEV